MITDEQLQQFWQSDEGQAVHQRFVRIAPHFQRMVSAVKHAESLGEFGWAFPIDMHPDDFVLVAEQSTTSDAADTAFLKYYTDHQGEPYKRLVESLINDSGLHECNDYLDEIRKSYDDGRFRICVAALLPMLDTIAQKTWNAPLSIQGKAHKSLERKIGVLPDSFTDYFWRSMRAFVDRVFEPSRQSKPPMLNRHWILHGRGLSDGTQVDCLRLLQAIRLLGRLIQIGGP